MRFDYENVPDTEQGEDFKAEVRLIVQSVFANPMSPPVFSANVVRLNERMKEELAASGYIYNRTNLTLDPVEKQAQGLVCAFKGPAGDAATVNAWVSGGMIARFILPIKDGKIWAGAAS